MSAVALFVAAGVACAGPDWVEDGDAGSDLVTAQPITSGKGSQVQRIFGTLSSAALALGASDDFEDMYQILVTDPTKLFFSTEDTGSNFQTALWLFDSDGRGLLANIFSTSWAVAGGFGGSALGNESTDGTEIVITDPGIYYIAITGFGREPFSSPDSDEPIFFFNALDEVSGPDGEGGPYPLSFWKGQGAVGSYEVMVSGVGFIPAPGALPLLALGALGARRRRRR